MPPEPPWLALSPMKLTPLKVQQIYHSSNFCSKVPLEKYILVDIIDERNFSGNLSEENSKI